MKMLLILIVLLPSLAYSDNNFSGYINIFEQKKQIILNIDSYDNKIIEENAWLFLSLNLYNEAEILFKRLLKHKEEDLYYLGLGYALRGQGKNEEAIKAFRKANRELEYVADNKVFKLIDEKEKRKNLEKYNQLIKFRDKEGISLDLAQNIMEISSYLGYWDSSILYAERSLSLKKDYLTKLRLSIFCYKNGDYKSAIKHLKELEKQYPDDAYILTLLSIISLKNYDDKSAQYYFEKAVKIDNKEDIVNLIRNFTGEKIQDINDFFVIQRGNLNLFFNYYNNSSDVTRKSYGEEINFRYKSNIVNIGHKRDYYYKFNRDRILRDDLHLGFKTSILNDLLVSTGISLTFLDNDKEIMPFYITLGKVIKNFYLSLSYDSIPISDIEGPTDNLLYNYASDFGAVKKTIRTKDKSAFIKYEDEKFVSFIKFVYGDYSDNNVKKSVVFDTSLKLLIEDDLRFGYTYFYLDYENPAPIFWGINFSEKSYYDPSNFEVHSIYLRGEKKNKFFNVNLELRLSYIPKSDSIGRTINLGAKIPIYNNHSLNVILRNYHHKRGVGRDGLEGRFWANQIFFGYNYGF